MTSLSLHLNVQQCILKRLRPALVLLLTLSVQAIAEEKKLSALNNNDNYLQMSLGLVFVVAMIYGCAWLVKRLNGASFNNAGKMRTLGGISLGTRERAVLVDVGGKQILLGVAPGRVNTLHVFDEPPMPMEQKAAEPEFARKLKEVLGQGEGR